MRTKTATPDNRFRLTDMGDDPDPIAPGTEGTVTGVSYFDGWRQISVNWDNGRTLALVCPPDTFQKIET